VPSVPPWQGCALSRGCSMATLSPAPWPPGRSLPPATQGDSQQWAELSRFWKDFTSSDWWEWALCNHSFLEDPSVATVKEKVKGDCWS